MPFFNDDLKEYFGTNNGAYSKVTHREATGDKSITLDLDEKDVIFSVYPADSFARKGGKIAPSNIPDKKDFIVHSRDGNKTLVKLTIDYPKSAGQELRLYFKQSLFRVDEADNWFIYTKEGEKTPYIGSFSDSELDNIKLYHTQQHLDDEDEVYQKQVGAAAVKQPTASTTMKFPRSPAVAINALRSAKYKCEANRGHSTFLTITGNQYMECHHLIPVSQQKNFTVSLDVEENIVCLCPNCHRHVHYGTGEAKSDLLIKLWLMKNENMKLRDIDISFEDFMKIYNI